MALNAQSLPPTCNGTSGLTAVRAHLWIAWIGFNGMWAFAHLADRAPPSMPRRPPFMRRGGGPSRRTEELNAICSRVAASERALVVGARRLADWRRVRRRRVQDQLLRHGLALRHS